MKIAALQPAYLPWLGHLEQINFCDKFVVLKDLQFSRGSWVNRNQILNNGKPQWITIPIKYQKNKRIDEIVIDGSKQWKKKHIQSLEASYPSNTHLNSLVQIIHKAQTDNLLEFLTHVNGYLYDIFNFMDKIEYRTCKDFSEDRNLRLIELCKNYGATQYFTGFSAHGYLDLDLFRSNGIEVIFQKYIPVAYLQKTQDFVPFMSVVDCLLNGYSPSQIKENNFFNANKHF